MESTGATGKNSQVLNRVLNTGNTGSQPGLQRCSIVMWGPLLVRVILVKSCCISVLGWQSCSKNGNATGYTGRSNVTRQSNMVYPGLLRIDWFNVCAGWYSARTMAVGHTMFLLWKHPGQFDKIHHDSPLVVSVAYGAFTIHKFTWVHSGSLIRDTPTSQTGTV